MSKDKSGKLSRWKSAVDTAARIEQMLTGRNLLIQVKRNDQGQGLRFIGRLAGALALHPVGKHVVEAGEKLADATTAASVWMEKTCGRIVTGVRSAVMPEKPRLRIYVLRPASHVLLNHDQGQERPGLSAAAITGHMFISINGVDGVETFYGKRPRMAAEPTRTPLSDFILPSFDWSTRFGLNRSISGMVTKEKNPFADGMVEFTLTEEQARAVQAYIQRKITDSGQYRFLDDNCCHFIAQVADVADVDFIRRQDLDKLVLRPENLYQYMAGHPNFIKDPAIVPGQPRRGMKQAKPDTRSDKTEP